MGAVVFNLPDLGEGLEDGTVTEWMVAEGDLVDLNQVLCTIETAKAEVEMPSPYAGRVMTLHGASGETIPVGSPLVTIDASSVGDAAGFRDALDGSGKARTGPDGDGNTTDDFASSTGPAGKGGGPRATRQPVLVGYGVAEERSGSRRRRRATHTRASSSPGPDSAATPGSALPPAGAAPAAPVLAGVAPAPPTSASAPAGVAPVAAKASVLASPPVRLLARRLGVDLDSVTGSGRAGLVRRVDVEAAATDAGAADLHATDLHAADLDAAGVDAGTNLAVAATAPATDVDGGVPGPFRPAPEPLLEAGPRPGEMLEVKGVRAVVAAHMARSRTEIPDATCGRWVDMSAVLDLRERLKRTVPEARLTPFAVLAWLVTDVLRREPSLNATWEEGDAGAVIRLHPHVHLGVAVDTPRGLVVANVRHAEQRGLGDLAAEMHRLATTGRAGKLTPAEMMGSTFTLSNYGAFGLDDGASIINHPEVAILGVGAVRKRPWVDPESEELVVRPTAKLSMSFDHRVADGGHAGRFMSRLADLIAVPERLLLER